MVAARCLAREEFPEFAGQILGHLDRFDGWNRRYLSSMLAAIGSGISHMLRNGLADEDAPTWVRAVLADALRMQMDLLHSRLHLSALGLIFASSGFDGGFARLEASYDLRDALSVGGGAIFYFDGDLIQFGRNDRLFAQIRWSF